MFEKAVKFCLSNLQSLRKNDYFLLESHYVYERDLHYRLDVYNLDIKAAF